MMVVVSSLTISRLSSQGSGISIAHACGEKERKGRNGKKKKHKYKVVACQLSRPFLGICFEAYF